MLLSVLLGIYFRCLLGFSFVSHPVVFCVLLMLSALSASGLVYMVVGFRWYLVLFCLVYVGGVYVLFIFVSIHSPNPMSKVGGGVLAVFRFFIVVVYLLGYELRRFPSFCESRYYLCSYFEG